MDPVVKEKEEICWEMYVDPFQPDVDCSPSARLLVCTADCSSLFCCLHTNLAYEILLKVSLYQANKHLKSCFTLALLAGFIRHHQKDWV